MTWIDQPYNKGSIVYEQSLNAWFVAQQNITVGSPAPGTTAAAAIWRKINSTYGATVFFGKGDYDPSDTTANNNWGMPSGTYPSGQQPLNGDSYFDVTTGTTTDFTVTTGAISYVITGDFVSAGNLASIGNVGMLDTWPIGAPSTPNYNEGYYYNTGHTFAGGAFNGQVAAGPFYLVYSGDPDADNDGWVLVERGANTTGPWPWTTNTPHAQKSPDVIAVVTNYGTVRRFTQTIGGADGETVVLVKGFPSTNSLFSFEIRDTGANGSIYTGQVSLSSSTAKVDMTPNVVRVDVNSFAQVVMGYNATDGYYLGVVINAAAIGRTFDVLIDSQDFDLGLLSYDGSVNPASEALKSFSAQADFKPASATRIMYYSNGSANNTYDYGSTRLHASLVATKANTLYKVIANTAWYGATFANDSKIRVKIFFSASNNGNGAIGAAVNVFRCIGVNVVCPFVKSYRIVSSSQSEIEIEMTTDSHSTSGYETVEMNFDMIGAVDIPAGNVINYAMKNQSNVTQLPSYTKFPEVSIFEIASWT